MKQDVSAQEELNDIACPSWEQIAYSLIDSAIVLAIIFTLIIVPSLL